MRCGVIDRRARHVRCHRCAKPRSGCGAGDGRRFAGGRANGAHRRGPLRYRPCDRLRRQRPSDDGSRAEVRRGRRPHVCRDVEVPAANLRFTPSQHGKAGLLSDQPGRHLPRRIDEDLSGRAPRHSDSSHRRSRIRSFVADEESGCAAQSGDLTPSNISSSTPASPRSLACTRSTSTARGPLQTTSKA